MESPIFRLKYQYTKSIIQTPLGYSSHIFCEAKRTPISINLKQDNRFYFGFNTEHKSFTITSATLEYIWCTSYTAYLLFELCDTDIISGAPAFSINNNKKAINSLKLLQQATNKLNNNTDIDWTNTNYFVGNIPIEASADTLFLRSLEHLILPSYIEYLKKLTYATTTSVDSSSQREILATTLFMDAATNKRDYTRRGLAWAISSLIKSTRVSHRKTKTSDNNINAFKTLIPQLKWHFEQDNHPVYLFLWILFHAQFKDVIPLTIPKGTTWRQALILKISHASNDSTFLSGEEIYQKKHG